MPRFLVRVESHAWGQGKTSAVRQVADWLQRHDYPVGGFSLLRNYRWNAQGEREIAGYIAHLYSTGEVLEIARTDRPEWFHNDPTDHRTEAPEGRRVYHVNLDAVMELVEHCRLDLEDESLLGVVFDEMGPILSRRPYQQRLRPHPVQDLLEDTIESDKSLAIVVYSDVNVKDRHVSTAKWREENQALGVARARLEFQITRNNFRTLSCNISNRLREAMPELAGVPSLASPT